MAGAPPAVSVVIPTRDRPEPLARAVRSVLEQDYAGPIECIVVFDREQPRPIPAPARPDRVLRRLVNDRVPGPAGARNAGVLASTGELIAFCDDDDEWLPGKLRAHVEVLARDGRACVAATGLLFRRADRDFPRISPRERVHLDDLVVGRRADLAPSGIAVRREALLGRIGLFDEAAPGGYAEDYDWLLRAATMGPLLAIRRPLVVVNGDRSGFFARWDLVIQASEYLLAKHPELRRHPRGAARIYGRMAFAYAASGDDRRARTFARRSIAADWRQPRGYLALLVTVGILPAAAVSRLAHAVGRGV